MLLVRLTKGGQVGTVIRQGNVREPINVEAGTGKNEKLVVLVNGGTANIAEIVASALKEKAGASIIGEHTFGDSVFERIVNLRSGIAMTLTAGRLLTADGREFTAKGIQPDIQLSTGGPQSSGDAAIQRALTALGGA